MKLSHNELMVMRSAFALGKFTRGTLAKHVGYKEIKRSTVYVVVESLMKRGLFKAKNDVYQPIALGKFIKMVDDEAQFIKKFVISECF